MAEVFLAKDTKVPRLVAIKILPKELANDHERLKRFLRESRIASSIQHENVARIYEIGEFDGTRFISMEFLKGQSLDLLLENGPLPPSDVIDIGIQVAAGLGEAHSKGIVHRDVKPANIMIMEDRKAKILDFGLAKVYDRKSDQFTSSRTEIGTAVGTVNYMSPEQVMGVSLDYRSDIFSLGIVLYECLTGQRPFAAKNLFATVENIVRSKPTEIASFVTGVPVELEQVVLKCLAKEAKNRFQSCTEVAEGLRAANNSIRSNVIVSKPEIDPVPTPAAAAETIQKPRSFYVETAITLLVFLFLCIYLLRSCH